MAALAVTANSRTAERVMSAYFHTSLQDGTFLEDMAPNFSPDTVALCRMFGMTPVKLCYGGADRRLQFEAFVVNQAGERRVFLTNHARSPERALVGHELVHRMRRERPDLYQELVEALATAGVVHDRWDAFYKGLREQTQRKEGRALSDEEIREEGVADLVGDLILDPAVWRALRQPTLLQRVHDWVGGVLRSLRRAAAPVDPLGGASLVRDRGLAMAAVSRVLGAWAASRDMPSPGGARDVPALASAAALRRDENAPDGAFRSALLDALVAARGAPVRAAWEQWLGWLDGAQRRGEFRQAERAWLGLDDFLKGRGTVTRRELVEFVREHQVQVRDLVLGADKESIRDVLAGKFEQRGFRLSIDNVPDGEEAIYYDLNGTEIGFQELPQDLRALVDEADKLERYAPKFAQHQLPGGQNYRELLLALPANEPEGEPDVVPLEQLPEGYEVIYDRMQPVDRRYGIIPPGQAHARPLAGSHGSAEAATQAAIAQLNDQRRWSWAISLQLKLSLAESRNFESGHFAHTNVIVHVRFNERTDADGKRVLFLEEIQSDWHQKGRKHGYIGRRAPDLEARVAAANASFEESEQAGENAGDWRRMHSEHVAALEEGARQGIGVPDAPFKSTDEWAMLAFKRMVVWSAEHGFDAVAWTTGAQQVERYNLSKQVDALVYVKNDDGTFDVEIVREGCIFSGKKEIAPSKLADYVGKDVAERIQQGIGHPMGGDARAGTLRLASDDLQVGGEGLRAFYDQILPAAVNKWAKRFGARVEPIRIGVAEADADQFEVVLGNGKIVQSTDSRHHAEASAACFPGATVREVDHSDLAHGLVVTPAMRDAALAGLPLFRRSPAAAHEHEETTEQRLAPAC